MRTTEAMEALGARLAALVEPPTTVFLSGELGAGKTTLARGFIRACGIPGAVKSPTFTLVESYAGTACEIFHFDLYRVSDSQELELAGWRDYFREGAICLIEWPERLGGEGVRPDLTVRFDIIGEGRRVTLEATNSRFINEIGW